MIGDLEQRVLQWAEINKRLSNSSAYRAGWDAARQASSKSPLPPGVEASLARFGFGPDPLVPCVHPLLARATARGCAQHPRFYALYQEMRRLGALANDESRPIARMPISRPQVDSEKKDQLEARLHELVLSGRLELGTAQREIATDWLAALAKYVH
jgi:hypothetical protein